MCKQKLEREVKEVCRHGGNCGGGNDGKKVVIKQLALGLREIDRWTAISCGALTLHQPSITTPPPFNSTCWFSHCHAWRVADHLTRFLLRSQFQCVSVRLRHCCENFGLLWDQCAACSVIPRLLSVVARADHTHRFLYVHM